jgi:hypothetical protein
MATIPVNHTCALVRPLELQYGSRTLGGKNADVLDVQNQTVLQATTVEAVILEVGFYFTIFWGVHSIVGAASQLFHGANPIVPDLAIPDGGTTWLRGGWKLQHEPLRTLDMALW